MHNLRIPQAVIHEVGREPRAAPGYREDHESAIRLIPAMVAKEGPIGVIVPGEEVVVEGADAGEVEEGAVAPAEVGRLLAAEALLVGVGVVPGEVEAGEEGFERRVAVDVGGEEEGAVLDEGAEGEEEQGEEEEGDGVGVEGGGRLLQDLGGGPEVAQPRVVAHRRRFLKRETEENRWVGVNQEIKKRAL